MAWSGQLFTVGQILTAAQMNNLQADITAQADGDSGAPKNQTASYATASVDQAALAANSVGQSELKDATSAQSVSVGAGSIAQLSLTGGSYSMATYSADYSNASIMFGFGNTAAGVMGYSNKGSSAGTAYVDSRYFSASPPYNFSNLFIYALIDNATKEILGLSVGGDPTWAYHGKTDIRPQYTDKRTGKKYRFAKTVEGILIPDLKNNPLALEGYLKGTLEAIDTPVEITMNYKDRDMDDKPHPWCENPPEFFIGRTVVLLNPATSIEQSLYDIMTEAGARESFDIIEQGFINIDNTPIIVPNTPKDLMVVGANWKNTGA